MDMQGYLDHLNAGRTVIGGSEEHQFMHAMSQEAIRICMEINNRYRTPEELRALMAELTGRPVDAGFGLFPPFNSDCGKNIHLGRDVFVNAGCKFQDQGGIYLGDRVLVGQNVVLATFIDITKEEEQARLEYERKLDTIDLAQKVIHKQMMVAQEIAGLLGETTAETKTTLTKLCRSLLEDGSDNGGK